VADGHRLLTRLTDDGAAQNVVAWRDAAAIGEAVFRGRVAAWMMAFRTQAAGAVGLFHSDGVEFAAALFGAWQAGRTIYLPGDNLPGTARQLEGRVAMFAGEWGAHGDALVPGEGATGHGPFERLAPDAMGVVVFTSGSTGEPQAIPKRLAQLAAEVETLDRTFGADIGDADMVATVSHQHIYGLLFKILWPMATGRSFVAHSIVVPEQLAAALRARRTTLISSPALLKRLPGTVDWSVARRELRAVFSSGGPLSPDGARLAEQLLGRTPIEVLGSSETGGIAWRRQWRGTDTPWTPLPGVRVRQEAGCLAVQSAHLPNEAWFTTADRIELVGADTFLLAGRADRIAKIEGERVSLVAIERALVASPWVREAKALPLAADREQLGAVVVLTAAGHRALDTDGKLHVVRTLRDLLADGTERVALPRRWRFVPELPTDAQGKTSQASLAALFESRATDVPDADVISQSEVHLELRLRIPPDLVYFDGHFDEVPVLPGVTQIDWAIRYGREYLHVEGAFVGLEAIKFHQLIHPGATVRLRLDWRVAAASLRFAIDSDAGRHASGRVVFSH
jgi:3-hydroxymyristoyl/3-hydroxydecanoyl-(acyl carrier protein) dehydratase